jgi:Nucleotidyl transferase of unknown function (DUF2204)
MAVVMDKTTYSDEEQLARAAEAVVRCLERADIPYAIVGGLALGVWGQPRSTYDVDLAVATPMSEIDHLCEALSDQPEFLRDPSVCPMPRTTLVRVHHPDNRKDPVELTLIDVLVLGNPFAESIINRRVLMEFEGRQFFFCSPEDLIVLKLIASRPQDLLDVQTVLKRRGGRLDIDYVQKWAVELDVHERWLRAEKGEAAS